MQRLQNLLMKVETLEAEYYQRDRHLGKSLEEIAVEVFNLQLLLEES